MEGSRDFERSGNVVPMRRRNSDQPSIWRRSAMRVPEEVIYKYSASPAFIDGSLNISYEANLFTLHVPSR